MPRAIREEYFLCMDLRFVLAFLAVYFVTLAMMHSRLDVVLSATPSDDSQSRRGRRCKPVYFWGGGKAGSTTLAALLKHGFDGAEYDPDSQFANSPKEICWAEKVPERHQAQWDEVLDRCGGGGNGRAEFALDACPRYFEERHARVLLGHDSEARFIMLVRDPVDRLVSQLNDHRKKGERTDVETSARALLELRRRDDPRRGRTDRQRQGHRMSGMEGRVSDGRPADGGVEMGAAYDVDAVDYKGRRRLREVQDRSHQKGVWRADGLDGWRGMRERKRGRRSEHNKHDSAVIRHRQYWDLSLYGRNLENLLRIADPSKVLIIQMSALTKDPQGVVDAVMNHIGGKRKTVQPLLQNQRRDRADYQRISNSLRDELRHALRSDVERLEKLLGKQFEWSWSPPVNDVAPDSDWIVTLPLDSEEALVQ